MHWQITTNRIDKLVQIALSWRFASVLFRHRVVVAAEHRHVLTPNLATVIDIGANRGQFALAVRRWAPNAGLLSFEPLPVPARVFRAIFAQDEKVTLHEVAIGPSRKRDRMHVSARDHSSSLLPITDLQEKVFPGTSEVSTTEVCVAPLEVFVKGAEILGPAMLKLDVQGFEYEALQGCESLLSRFDWVYCECSFVELYAGQKMAADIIAWLRARGLELRGIFNVAYDSGGTAVQGDFLFGR